MITLGGVSAKIHLATSPVDLRRGYAGLYTMIEHEFGGEPQSGHLWVFLNKQRNLVKVFWWDQGGMAVLAKRLHEGTFSPRPQVGDKIVTLTPGELQLLLDGLDLARLRPRRWVRRPPGESGRVQEPAACQ